MGWIGEISTLEELEALMCGNILPVDELPESFYRLAPGSGARRLILYLSKMYMQYHIK